MKMDNKKKRKEIIFIAIIFALALSFAFHVSEIMKGFFDLFDIVKPVLYGFIIAFILNVPMSAISKQLKKLSCKVSFLKKEKVRDGISLLITVVIFFLLLFVIIANIIPYLVDSIDGLKNGFNKNAKSVIDWVTAFEINNTSIEEYLMNIKWSTVFKKVTDNAGNIFTVIFGSIPQVGSSVMGWCVSLIVGIYILLDKKRFLRIGKDLLYVYCSDRVARKITHVGKLFVKTYSDFLSGQCVESCILASLIFLVLTVLRIPYAGMISIMAGIFQFIPYVGTFLAWIIGAVLIVLTKPDLVILYLVVFQIIQFCEGQFIYPRVVGGSVGLPAVFTLIAVFVGGNLFGILGMLFFIPLTSVIYQLVGENVRSKKQKKCKQKGNHSASGIQDETKIQ